MCLFHLKGSARPGNDPSATSFSLPSSLQPTGWPLTNLQRIHAYIVTYYPLVTLGEGRIQKLLTLRDEEWECDIEVKSPLRTLTTLQEGLVGAPGHLPANTHPGRKQVTQLVGVLISSSTSFPFLAIGEQQLVGVNQLMVALSLSLFLSCTQPFHLSLSGCQIKH